MSIKPVTSKICFFGGLDRSIFLKLHTQTKRKLMEHEKVDFMFLCMVLLCWCFGLFLMFNFQNVFMHPYSVCGCTGISLLYRFHCHRPMMWLSEYNDSIWNIFLGFYPRNILLSTAINSVLRIMYITRSSMLLFCIISIYWFAALDFVF